MGVAQNIRRHRTKFSRSDDLASPAITHPNRVGGQREITVGFLAPDDGAGMCI